MQISSSSSKINGLYAQKQDSVVVVCAADNNYAMPLAVTIRSALEHLESNKKMLLFVIDDGIYPRVKCRIVKSLPAERCEVRWLPRPEQAEMQTILNEENAKFTVFSKATLYRLMIPELLPREFSKAIYLDCDLVVKADISKLWEMDLGDNYLLAACTKYVRIVSHSRGLANWRELGFAPDDKHLSAGVLVLNLDKWRSNNLCAIALDYIVHNHQYIRGMDNDVLVAIVRNGWGELDLRWNNTEARRMTQEEIDDSYILHYTSPEKPWSVPQNNPATDLFFHYLRMTDWKGYRQDIPQRLWRRLKREVKQLQQRAF
ncbi:glycosyltransferase family 8 protein [Leptolyngbya sp. NK1-12]|uniref:Glycosyltransferase family 8 protein n=1 Tax=Leptolyngbya sp. NK1-12 TaxID=2547451 RepID=A0AA96WL86_9CYAN|nr:glycosyltransferase family 8 protein [Leptolyngbya sp. NK1-12]WNZ27668.1 glycosyltransferase family 8 protein [Leptolyngbya sp. NK1-12]